ncbi:MAG: 3-phosphoshikimate 1-carboxyvinyltransferase [Clostridia bacterium]|nr:3-phosphoshikimate 1-carboxyvinyltransferase [Clostridia bacterium]
MRAVIKPGALRGVTAAPPSKSMAHRMLICAALAEGESLVQPIELSEDILATMDGLRALGAGIVQEGDELRVTGCRPAEAESGVIPCRESGSTLRFLLPLCLLSGKEMTLTGSERLLSRPLDVYETLCAERGFSLERTAEGIRVRGKLTPGEYTVRGDLSSQFLTGLLYALSLLDGESEIRILPPIESEPYLEMTLEALAEAGVPAKRPEKERLVIPGGQRFRAGQKTVEGDWSNAAFFEALRQAGNDLRITGLREDSLQGDKVCREYFRRIREGGACVDVTDCPDLAPVLMAFAAMCGGARLEGTRRLRFKESDRGQAMAEELAKFGVAVTIGENAIEVGGGLKAPMEILQGHNDHRIVMSLAVLCTRTGGTVDGAEAVRKSFPGFWDAMRMLGARVSF